MPSGGSQTTVQRTEPWSGQIPYLLGDAKKDIAGLFPEANRLYGQPGPLYYPGQTVAPFSPEHEMALNAQAARALYGSPLTAAGGDELQRTLGGGYLNGNPYLQNAIDAASRGLVRNYQNAVAPGIDSSFSLAGRYGSGAHQAAQSAAQQNLAAAERGNMLNALNLVPGYAAQDYNDIAQLNAVGQTREQMAQSLINDQIARWNFEQQQPADKLRQYAALVQGNFGSTQTTTAPYSAGTGILGGAASGAGIGSAFGPWGTAIGAGLGGLLSLF
jgi:hypothetical protein